MKKVINILKQLDLILITLLLFSILVVICMQVLSRILPGNAISWTIELGEILLVYMVWLGIAAIARANGHTRIDLLYQKLSARAQCVLHIIGSLCTVAYLGILAWFTIGAMQQYIRLNASTTLLRINMLWVRLPILLGSIHMAIVVIVKEILRCRELLSGHKKEV